MDTRAIRATSAVAAGLAGLGHLRAAPAGTADARRAAALHVADRCSFGATPELVEEIAAATPQGWIEQQLDPASILDVEADVALATFPSLQLSNRQIRQLYADRRPEVRGELQGATLLRAVVSRRQLFEVVVEMWSDHLSVSLDDGVDWYKTVDDRDVVRRHAMGRFADLLLASARSPAMLSYLDNRVSRGERPNENYARELLELHTLGVDGGYTEADVRGVALALSGWTVSETHEFHFEPRWHHTGPLEVRGWRAPATDAGPGAVARGESLLAYLARHPSTARHVARRICRRIVADDPPAELVDSAAAVYLQHDTAIVPTLRHVLASEAFRTSAAAKVRRPFGHLARVLRATDADVLWSDAGQTGARRQLRGVLGRLGHLPFEWPAPDGYPDVADHWTAPALLLERWNAVLDLLNGYVEGVTITPDRIAAREGRLSEYVDRLCRRLLARPVPPGEHEALLAFVGRRPDSAATDVTDWEALGLVALILSSPSAQRR